MKFVASLLATVAIATSTSANPIRRVVDMLQAMSKKVEEEGVKEKDLMDKFMCYCKTNKGTLEESVRAAEAKAPQLAAAIESATAAKTQMDDELKEHKADREEAKAAIEKATTLRAEEKAAFDKTHSDLSTNLAAMNSAVTALEKGLGGFLQTSAAHVLSTLVDKFAGVMDVEEVRSFLQSGNAPAGGTAEIVGILKQMAEQMGADLADANTKEEAAIKAFDGMVAAKNAEIEAATQAIEEKTARSGELAVEIVNLKNESGDVLEGLEEDRKFLTELNSSCATKEAEWEERQKTRADELLALSETIKVLNDDDALDLFNKASGMKKPAMLLQLDEAAPQALKAKALSLIQMARSTQKSSALAMISMMLRGKGSFDQVTKMIDDLVATLGQEQKDDEKHLDYCRTELDSAEDTSKDLARKHQELESQMETLKASIAEYADEIAALTAGIQALDKSVAEATEQRKKEHADYVETLANNNAAKQLIDFAKNRLNKFYNPKLYKAPKEREMTEEERVFVANGGTLAPTPAPGGIAGTGISGAFVQIKAHSPDCDCIGKNPCGCSGKAATSFIQEQAAPAPPPETFDAYTKKGEESNGVIAMMDMLVKDLDTEIQEAEHNEKEGQKDYEEMMQTSSDKRATDSKSITNAEGAKAEAESNLESAKGEHTSNGNEILANNEYTANLHAECDFLMKNFDLRKEARTAEVEGLKNAKAVLNGADYE